MNKKLTKIYWKGDKVLAWQVHYGHDYLRGVNVDEYNRYLKK